MSGFGSFPPKVITTSRVSELTKICDPNEVSSDGSAADNVKRRKESAMKKMQDLHTMNRIVEGPEQAHLKVSIQTVCIFFYCRFYSLTGLISLYQHDPSSFRYMLS
jgi:hypothetical protein